MITITDNNNVFKDKRGLVGSFYHLKLDERYPNIRFVEDRFSISRYGCIRGFHADSKTNKLLICLYGNIKLISWDIENKIKEEIFLVGPDKIVFIPKNHLLAHQCISNNCVLVYKWSHLYGGPDKQYTVRYDDPTINANWVDIPPVLSKRDSEAQFLDEIFSP